MDVSQGLWSLALFVFLRPAWHGWMGTFGKIRVLSDTSVTLTLTVFVGHRSRFVDRFSKDLFGEALSTDSQKIFCCVGIITLEILAISLVEG